MYRIDTIGAYAAVGRLSLALLKLDHVASGDPTQPDAGMEEELNQIQETLRHAIQEVRAISAGLILPHLGDLNLADVIEHAVQAHRRRTRSVVEVQIGALGENSSLATKIAVYRIVQEALTNAWRHAGGNSQRVSAEVRDDAVRVVVSDGGPGFDATATIDAAEDHLGLLGMRERVETLGGEFRVESSSADGTRIIVTLPLTLHPGPIGEIDD